MLSQTKENYLKALYYLHEKDEKISITELGLAMSVSKPTVNDMVKKLEKDDLVSYQKYKPLKLTDKGIKAASLIIRKHRLSEMFLHKMMGFGWEEVHEIAEEIEHIASEKLFDRMDELMGFPTTDPHGSPIPDKDGFIKKLEHFLLSEMKSGDRVIVKALNHSSPEFLAFLNKKEIQLGSIMDILETESFDESITINYLDNKTLVLNSTVTERIWVERLD